MWGLVFGLIRLGEGQGSINMRVSTRLKVMVNIRIMVKVGDKIGEG